jgi:Ni,Fe-hydrogenase III small subunit
MDSPRLVAYHAGTCALCGEVLERSAIGHAVDMHVFGPAGTVILRSWLCCACRPTPDGVLATSGRLADRILWWYRADPSLWPTLRLSVNG